MIPLQNALRCRLPLAGLQLIRGQRFLQVGRPLLNDQTSFFGEMTKKADLNSEDPNKLSNKMSVVSDVAEAEKPAPSESITIENDTMLQKYIQSQQQPEKLAPHLLLTPFKRKLYMANCQANGFYKNDTIVSLPGSSERYKLHLSGKEIEVLEPSVYVKSFRIKSSMKKATVLLRLLNGLDVKKALTQCHFSAKQIARDVAQLLEKGIEDGKRLGLEADDLYISQIWTGSDGMWGKRLDCKARGRTGLIHYPHVHVRCILKTKSVTKSRLAYEARVKDQKRKPWIQLADKPVRGVPGGAYKW